jgi:hypothetical protein
MSHAHRIEVERSGSLAESADETASLSLAAAQFWMLPLLLLQVICELFSRHLAELKAMRRTRPLPTAWRTHLSALREAEWPIAVLKAEGARQLLAGLPLRLAGIACPEPPQDFQPTLPESALAFHRRLEAIVRFNADPEAHVRRHAARIAMRQRLEPRPRPRQRPRLEFSSLPVVVAVVVPVAVPVGLGACARVRAPP